MIQRNKKQIDKESQRETATKGQRLREKEMDSETEKQKDRETDRRADNISMYFPHMFFKMYFIIKKIAFPNLYFLLSLCTLPW